MGVKGGLKALKDERRRTKPFVALQVQLSAF